jgi:hypothetical protein
MPFHLQALGYTEISALVGYLLFTYVGTDLFKVIRCFDLILFPSQVV